MRLKEKEVKSNVKREVRRTEHYDLRSRKNKNKNKKRFGGGGRGRRARLDIVIIDH